MLYTTPSFVKMPRRRTTSYMRRRRTRRRAIVRRPTRRPRRMSIRRTYVPRFKAPLGNFPSSKTVALRYVSDFTLDASATASDTRVYSVNSIFDPDQTGIGHQPMFRDNYAAIYSTYRVNYSTVTVVPLTTHVVNTAQNDQVAGTSVSTTQYYAANERGCRLWILRDQSTSDYPADLNTLVEEGNKDFVWRYCPQNTSQKMPILRFSCWPHRLFDVDKKDDRLQAVQGANPSFNGYYIIGISSIGAAANPDPVACQVIITYNVTYTDLIKNQGQN